MAENADLGEFNAPVLIFGGPYSNLQATRAVLTEAERRDIPPERMLCTGDVVAYCAEPQETVDLIRQAGIPVVMGNCEESLGETADDCGCGFEEGSSCDLLSARWYAYANARLDDESRAWMRGLPRRIAFSMAGHRIVAIHGGVHQINRFMFPSTPWPDKAAEIEAAGADGVVTGHSGLPFTQIVNGCMWHNAGAIGLPANDGTPRTWYSVLTPASDGITVDLCELIYDHTATAQRMRENSLPLDYADALRTGLWPSDDFLPEEDHQERGNARNPASVIWRNRNLDRPNIAAQHTPGF